MLENTQESSSISRPYISVVVPIYDEEGNIISLDKEIKEAVSKITSSYEIIYINDGSKDGSLKELKSLRDVTIINFNRNYGQATAFDAGFKHATGELVISMDGDGQNNPHEMQLLLDKLKKDDLDVVAGWRKIRGDKNGIKVLTRIGRMLRRLLIKDTVHDTGCSFRVYTNDAVKSLDIGGEMHRYILALLRWKGYRIGEVVVSDRVRIHGVSKYNYSKAVRGFIDLIYVWFIHKYSQRPLHFFGYMSLSAFFVGFLSFLWSAYGKIFLGLSLNRNGWFFITFFFLLAGIMFFSFGIVIDLLIRILYATSAHEHRYYVRNIIKTNK
jgi:glycosyltransferase involved in cell wall biosynthesis